jgi:hypothetical protein
MKRSGIAVCAVLIAVLLFGCGDNTPTGSGRAPTVAELTGTWNFNSVYGSTTATIRQPGHPDSTIQNDTSFTCTGNNDSVVYNATMRYTLTSDEDFINNMDGTGTWSLTGGLLRMVPFLSDTTDVFVSLNGTMASFTTFTSDSMHWGTVSIIYNTTTVVSATKK